ncbi:hypothetical protein M758_8G011600 [Ceratodon purpureus]|uniref:Uncharacterized protein n=1 Tax=Ceratodon purpureus TaxID=3225 RepID=A0A8T0GVZ8_CERPU|nr:hypothetical protein KC19_8G012200 [Ceratodon purpureus]KAG0607233.1 hypothetical protein M758_8G011600 [Ceratodon purpureus]
MWNRRFKTLITDSKERGKILIKLLALPESERDLIFDDGDDAVVTSLLSLIEEDTSPPRLVYRMQNNVGFARMTLQTPYTAPFEDDFMIDTGCGMELLLPKSYHEQVQVTAVLVKKGSGEFAMKKVKYLTPFVLTDAQVPEGGIFEEAPMPHVSDDIQPMDINAILRLSSTSTSDVGGGCILGLPGLLSLGLEVHVSKQYLYPTSIVRALAY